MVSYRELAPTPELRGVVRAYFSFAPSAEPWQGRRTVVRDVSLSSVESFCSPVFADGRTSLVMELGRACRAGGGWTAGMPIAARVIGALRTVAAPAGDTRAEMIGVYLEPGATSTILRIPASELTDRVVDLELPWGTPSGILVEELAALDEEARVDRLEAALLERVRCAPVQRSGIDVVGLARLARRHATSMTVTRLADVAGVSRRHLARAFGQVLGVSPKRYCRLSRFHAGLAYAGAGTGVRWAQVAVELGYADQSHMIAEFRELSSLTPEALAAQRWFHPFILEARSSRIW